MTLTRYSKDVILVMKLRAGVVGLRMGLNHATGYQANPHTDLVAICDVSEERLRDARRRLGDVPTFTSFEEMLDHSELDVVSVTTPNRFHAPLSIAALERGIHTLCTKPIARTVAEARAMLAAAHQADKALMVGHQLPYTTPARHAKHLIEKGEVGDVYHAELTYLRRKCTIAASFLDKESSGGGPLIDLIIHLLDLALWLLDTPKPLHASGLAHHRILHVRRPEASVEDLMSAQVAFEGGLSCSIRTSYEANIPFEQKLRDLALYGTKLGVAFDPWTGEFSLGDVEGTRIHRVEEENPKQNQQHYSVDAFIDGVQSGDRMWKTVERGIAALSILNAIYHSAQEGGRTVTIES